MTAEATPTLADRPGPRRRILRRVLITFAILYLLAASLLFLFQETLIFPGSRFGRPLANTEPGQQIVRLQTASGGEIAALYARGAGDTGPDGPTVVFFYGNGECVAYHTQTADYFSRLGYNVLIPEYPGYAMSPGRPSGQGLYDTADACFEYLTDRLHVPPGRVAVIGRSIGGAPAIYLASKHPLGALVTVSAFRSLGEIAGNTVHHLFPVSLLVRHRLENLGRMKDVHCPTLIVHGTVDELIPFDSAEALGRATTAPVTYHKIEGAHHNDVYEVGGRELEEAVESFLRGSIGRE